MEALNRPISDRPFRTGVRRLSVRHLLIAVILLILTEPFVGQLPAGELVESVLMTLVMLTAVAAVGGRRKTLTVAAVLVTPAVLGKWVQHVRADLIPAALVTTAAIVFVAFVIFHLLRFVLRAPRVGDEVLCAALSAYLMLGILWAFGYMLLSRLDPRSFLVAGESGGGRPVASFEALFLSFGALSAVGYDEVRAASKPARMLLMTEAMTGTFYIAMLIARLVAIYSGNEPAQAGQGDGPRGERP